MSITDSFDMNSKEIINPAEVIPKIEGFPETVIASFSKKSLDILASFCELQEISHIIATGLTIPIYKFEYKGKTLGIYHTLLGGPASGGLLEEVIAKGAKKVLFFGSCGSLDKSITSGHLIVPTAAYRDEGTSYHYAPPSDYIEVKTADKLSEILSEIGAPHCKSKIWTTDAFYRETMNNIEARKRDGCCGVDMECASVMAVGDFRNIEVYQFVYAADCLDGDKWDERILSETPDDLREAILHVALESAIRL